MCGIFGHFSNKFTKDIQEQNNRLKSATDSLYHRGPDDNGLETFKIKSEEDKFTKLLSLGHTRLFIFDFDGSISANVAAYQQANPGSEFEDIWENVLVKHEGNVDQQTIAPKFFETIAEKTVLILYPGKYSKVLIPDRHFIPLERNYSNIDDVVTKLRDHSYFVGYG